MHKFVLKRLKSTNNVRHFGLYMGRKKVLHFYSLPACGERIVSAIGYGGFWTHPAHDAMYKFCASLARLERTISASQITAEYIPGTGYKIAARTI